MRERRYQLRKEAVGVVRHHPWLFRDHMSSAASVFGDGDRVRLVDGHNRVIGHGVYAAQGAIAVRVVRLGDAPPDAAWLRGRVAAALARRQTVDLRTASGSAARPDKSELSITGTDGIRLVNGESDGVPAVVADRFGDAVVVTCYAAGFDAIARYVARLLGSGALADHAATIGRATTLVLRRGHRRVPEAASDLGDPSVAPAAEAPEDAAAPRALRGALGVAHFHEDGLTFAVDLAGGQKTGAYLDLRGLRREVAAMPLAGTRVLNLFAYTGMLGRAAEAAGAASIVQVDASAQALAFARAHHVTDPARHELVVADAFAWLPQASPAVPYDLVVIDPPAMTSRAGQVPKVLAAYRTLYRAAARVVAPQGTIVAACCTSRVSRDAFRATVADALHGFQHVKDLAVEPDHPATFPQADYLKIGLWRRTS
jgi:23S rRNA (cytosine1962-C5)-methyltransferase